MRSARGARFSLAFALVGLGCAAARAESALRLSTPRSFGVIPAASYDEQGHRVGAAHLAIEKLDGGHVRIAADSGYERGARNVAVAELEPSGAGDLRLLSQESHTFRPDGSLLGVLRVDHRAAVGSCSMENGSSSVEELPLPAADRVVNVPLNLFFLPLLRGETRSLEFQMLLCRGAPRLLDFEARVEQRSNGTHPPVVEVRYRPELGSLIGLVAQHFVPRLSFWFDPAAENPWLAHQIPLYSGGPAVVVARDGVPLAWLGIESDGVALGPR